MGFDRGIVDADREEIAGRGEPRRLGEDYHMPGVSVRLEGRKPPGDDVAPIGVLKQIHSLPVAG
jgi:hypothetical protein